MTAITEAAISDLPEPVRRSMRRSGVIGREMPSSVVVQQEGRIRTSPDRKWLRFVAREVFTLDPPGFVWDARLKPAGITAGRAVDSLDHGRGKMKVRLLGLTTVVDETGPEMDQGAAMRWLNETMWFPTVWASDTIMCEPIDAVSAAGTLKTERTSVTAEFRFDEEGRLVDMLADRYRDADDGFVMTPWSTPLTGHARFDGIEVPSSGRAVWKIDDDVFEYIQIRITGIRYSYGESDAQRDR